MYRACDFEPELPLPPAQLSEMDDVLVTSTRHFTPQALRLFLKCTRFITLGLAKVASEWWRRGDPVASGFAECLAVRTELKKSLAISDIMRTRLERFPARHRKHYTPEERFKILVLMKTYGLTSTEVARIFLIDAQTISRWQREALKEPESNTNRTILEVSQGAS
ncbi:MAG: hypothetical protein GY906_04220 [bacterium]|nr:hypothetical protein [bacterium]